MEGKIVLGVAIDNIIKDKHGPNLNRELIKVLLQIKLYLCYPKVHVLEKLMPFCP